MTEEFGVMMEVRRCTTGFEDEGRRTGAKECRQTVGAGKGKK